MSRHSPPRSTAAHGLGQPLASDDRSNALRPEHIIGLCGSDAPTAAAYCALEAWFDCNEDDYRLWLDLFRRLRN